MDEHSLLHNVMPSASFGRGAVVGALLAAASLGAIGYFLAGPQFPVWIDGTSPMLNFALAMVALLGGGTMVAEWTVGPLSVSSLGSATAATLLGLGALLLLGGMIYGALGGASSGSTDPSLVATLLAGAVSFILYLIILAVIAAVVSAVVTAAATLAKLIRFW